MQRAIGALRAVAGRSAASAAAMRLSPSAALWRSQSTGATTAPPPAKPDTVSVIAAPFSFGQPLDGVERGAAEMKAAGLRGKIAALGYRVHEHPAIEVHRPTVHDPVSPIGGRNAYAVGVTAARIAEATAAAAAAGHFVLTLGGDHSIAMGSLGGILRARPEVGVVWVDAHADINAPETSPSGNVHGMPLSFLMKLVDAARVPGCEWVAELPRLAASSLVYVGLRDLDVAEKRFIKTLGLRAYTMHDLDRYGVGKVMEMGLDYLAGTKPRALHLSYDIDAIDPTVAPSTGTSVPGGLNYREAHYVAEACAESGLLGSMDVVEINPDLVPGAGGMATVAMGVELVQSALGKSILE